MKTSAWLCATTLGLGITSALFMGCPMRPDPETPKLEPGLDHVQAAVDKDKAENEVAASPRSLADASPQLAKRASMDELDKPIQWGPDVTLTLDASKPIPSPDANPVARE